MAISAAEDALLTAGGWQRTERGQYLDTEGDERLDPGTTWPRSTALDFARERAGEHQTIEERIARAGAEMAVTAGLGAELARSATEPHADVVLHALHVAGGAAAIGVGSIDPSAEVPVFAWNDRGPSR